MARPRERYGFGNHGASPRRTDGGGVTSGTSSKGRLGDGGRDSAVSVAPSERSRGSSLEPGGKRDRAAGFVQDGGKRERAAGFVQDGGKREREVGGGRERAAGFGHGGDESLGASLSDGGDRGASIAAESMGWNAASWEEGPDSSTLRELTPSWALGSETSAEHPSTQTLTPLGQSMRWGQAMAPEHAVSSEFDEFHDPFRGTKYRGIRQIGAGGMGQVFLVLHRELGCEFVAKLLRPELCNDLRTLDRVRIEAQSLGRLEHPHVVSVTDFGYSVDGAPFIVMEPLCGLTLAQRLKRGPVPLCEALVFARATLSALAAAHAMGIVHRDIKPHNLFLHTCEDGRIVLKVLDFGAARVLPGAPPAAPIPLSLPTQTGMVLGTPRFVSPEAASGCPVDARGDLYAVGLVLYLLVAGRGPFDHVRTLSEVFRAHASLVPQPPGRYAREELPAGLDEVVMRALSKQPEHRYQSAGEFDAALAGVQRALASRIGARAKARFSEGPALGSGSSPALRQPSQLRPSQLQPSWSRSPQLRPSQPQPSWSGSPRPPSWSRSPPLSPQQPHPLMLEPRPSVASLPLAKSLVQAGRRAHGTDETCRAHWTFWTQAPVFWAALRGKSRRTDRNASRPAHLSLRPMATVVLFVGTLVLTSVVGAGGATLLGRMVGSFP